MTARHAAAPRTPSFWALQTAGWLAFGVAMALSRVGQYPLPYMMATKGALMLLGFVVSLGLRALYQRLLGGERSLGWLIVVTVVASYGAALVWTAAYNSADAWIVRELLGRPPRNFSHTGGALYHAFVLVAWSVLYVGARHHAQLQAERERSLRADALAQEARLRALRYQLDPHFLFNTLNAISTLVVEQRTPEATRMIARLSDFLRLTLQEQGGDEVPLAREIDFVRRYLEIERVRFGARLRVAIDVPPELEDAAVPLLILQPLVENAVRHGVSPREEGGCVTVRAERAGATLRLTVTDDGAGPATDGTRGGIGLANVRERLRVLHGDDQRVELRAGEGGGSRAVLELPYRGTSVGARASATAEERSRHPAAVAGGARALAVPGTSA